MTYVKSLTLAFALSSASSFAVTLGEITIIDPVLGNRSIVYEEKDNYAVVEGDIVIGKVSQLKNPGAVVVTKIGGTRWKAGIIPFEMSEELPLMNKLAVLKAIFHLQQKTSLEFVELTSKNRENYKDFISFIPAEGTTCSSYVGKHGGKQEINLSPRCTDMNTVHEIGHALGLWHEQSRADRTNYIRILWENIDDEHRYNFDQHLSDGKDIGEYDYNSIMHYGPYAFSKNGEKTLIPIVAGVEIGQRESLSEKDILAIEAMYPEA